MRKPLRQIFLLTAPLGLLVSCGDSNVDNGTEENPVHNTETPTSTSPTPRTNTTSATDRRAIERLVETSDNALNFQQAYDRYHNAIRRREAGHTDYTNDRAQQAPHYYKTCAQIDFTEDQTPENMREVWRTLQGIRTSQGYVTQQIANYIAGADIPTCQKQLEQGVVGTIDETLGLIKLSYQTDLYEYTPEDTIAHEAFHLMQGDNGHTVSNSNLRLQDFQMKNMAVEASAKVIGRLSVFERHLMGENVDWNPRPTGLDRAIEGAYTEALSENPHLKALEIAGTAGWYAVFNDEEWLHGYNQMAIINFMNRYLNRQLDPFSSRYTVEDAARTGRLSANFNITSNLTRLPSFNERTGYDRNIAYIFQYMELEQLAMVYGRNNRTYLEQLNNLEADANPYLGIDLNALGKYRGLPIIDLMKCLSGQEECKSADGRVTDFSGDRINMRP